jgi:hypothetical protein
VRVFEREGHEVSRFAEGGSPTAVAVDNSCFYHEPRLIGEACTKFDSSNGDVYISEEEHGIIEKFQPKGELPSEGYEYASTLSSVLKYPEGVAVDGSGNLYVSQFNGPVVEFDAEGGDIATLGSVLLGGNTSIAVNASGSSVYVDAGFRDRIVKLTVEPVAHTVTGEFPLDTMQPGGVAINQAAGTVFVADNIGENGPHVAIYAAGAIEGDGPLEEFGAGEIAKAYPYPYGIAYSAQGKGEIYITETSSNQVRTFVPSNGSPPPVVEKCSTTAITPVSAAVGCTVNPNGAEVAEWHVEYGEPGNPPSNTLGGELSGPPSEVHEPLESLNPQREYRWRLLAKNKSGQTEGRGIFTTPSAVEGVGACSAAVVENESAALKASLEPNLATEPGVEYFFEYGKNVSGSGSYEHQTPVVELKIPGEVRATVGQGAETPLESHTLYHCRLVAQRKIKTNIYETDGISGEYTTLGPPIVSEEFFSEVGVSSAKVDAQVDDEGFSGIKGASSYQYEYGPCPEPYEQSTCTASPYPSRTPPENLDAAEEDQPAPSQLTQLSENTYYHVRIAATDVRGTSHGPELILHTFAATTSSLPDGRVYEMVTPPKNENANVNVPATFGRQHGGGVSTNLPFQAALDGDAVAYVGDPTSGGNGNVGTGGGNEYLARRSLGGGWRQYDIQPPAYVEPIYQAFSNDLSIGIFNSCVQAGEDLPALAPGGLEREYQDLYTTGLPLTPGGYRPFFSAYPANNQPPSNFGAFEVKSYEEVCSNGIEVYALAYAGASSNLSHLLFEANGALTPEATGGGGENNLYDSVGGRLHLVNVLPNGTPDPNATFGWGVPNHASIPDFSHVISSDGSHIFWTDLNTGYLYMREHDATPEARTVLISEGGRFWTASADGSKVFFTDGELYEYNLQAPAGKRLTDLTPGVNVRGVVGTSENGEYVYYVNGSYELDLWHEGAVHNPTLIAALSPADNSIEPPGGEVEAGDWRPGLGSRTAEVTPDGHAVVFMSRAGMRTANFPAGYENRGLAEVYIYEAGSGELFCASCDPSGEPPSSPPSAGEAAAFLPASHSNTYVPRWVSEGGGRVFFDSEMPLLKQDTNGVQDVYEWERDEEGTCREIRGCVYLLSGGGSASKSWLLDSSSSGHDVFIITRAQLTAQDQNDDYNVFDARIGGVEQSSPVGCSGAACQGVPPAAPIFSTPSSVTFNGVGNFLPHETESPPPGGSRCKKGFIIQHGKCVKPRTKVKKTKHTRRARKMRGAHRAANRRR